MSVSGTRISKGGRLFVTADITNTGSADGAEVVQLYANFNGDSHYGKNGNMRRKLIGFRRVELTASMPATQQPHRSISQLPEHTACARQTPWAVWESRQLL